MPPKTLDCTDAPQVPMTFGEHIEHTHYRGGIGAYKCTGASRCMRGIWTNGGHTDVQGHTDAPMLTMPPHSCHLCRKDSPI